MVRHLSLSGQDRPLGDREGSRRRWSPEEIERVSDDEVKNPEGNNDIDSDVDIDETEDASKD